MFEIIGVIVAVIIVGITILVIYFKIWNTITWKIKCNYMNYLGDQIIGDSKWFIKHPEVKLSWEMLGKQLKELKYIHVESIRNEIENQNLE